MQLQRLLQSVYFPNVNLLVPNVVTNRSYSQSIYHNWNNKENIQSFFSKIREKYNFKTYEDWNSITHKHIKSNGGRKLLEKYSIYELKCMACPEGKLIFDNPKKPSGYWDNKENIHKFLLKIKGKFNINTPEDWNSITNKHIRSNGGTTLLNNYSIYELKCMACPEGKSIFNSPKQAAGYWDRVENIYKFLDELKGKYNLKTPEDWNSVTQNIVRINGGNRLLAKYSLYDLKCMACPEEKFAFNNPKKSSGYWEIQTNIDSFLLELKEKYNLNTPEDWNSITHKHIQSNGGRSLLRKYSIHDLKCMACPEGESIFNSPKQVPGYWDKVENIYKFLDELKGKYNLKTPEDWNSITNKQIQTHGGNRILSKYTMYDLKCMACPDGELIFNNPKKVSGYWENKENIHNFFAELKQKYNLNTPEDWNSITASQIQLTGGRVLLTKYSIYELKCMACPEGISMFNNPPGYWEKLENIHKFLNELKEKYDLNTPEDWNNITTSQIQSNGGWRLLTKFSIFELKCMACPEGKLIFSKPNQIKPPGFWEDETNRNDFFEQLKVTYNLQTPLDWKRLSRQQIQSMGGNWLLNENNQHLETKIRFDIIHTDEENSSTFVPLKELISEILKDSIRKRSSQRWLFLQIQKLFPHEEIVEDYYHSELSRETGSAVQFDVFMIERNIAVEYHGKQHYEDIPQGFCNLEAYKHRDVEKENICSKHGIKLIVIPYWWDNKLDSLRTTLYSEINK